MSPFAAVVVGSLPATATVGSQVDISILLGRADGGQPTVAQVSCFLFAADGAGKRLTATASPLPSSIVVGTLENAPVPNREFVRFKGVQFRFAGSFRLGISIYQIVSGTRVDHGTFLLGPTTHRVEVTA